MKVIGIGGQLGSGKDTLADYLAKKLNGRKHERKLEWDLTPEWQRIGFAHAVKKVFMESFDVSWDFIEEWKRKPETPPGFDKNIRQSLQFIGDGFRQIKSNIWIEMAFRQDIPKVISDVRYLNEAVAIRAHGGLTVLVWREGFENNDPNPSEAQIKPTVDWFVKSRLEGDVRVNGMPGEQIVAEYTGQQSICNPSLFDFFIRNEGSLDQLYQKVDLLLIPKIEELYAS